VRCPQCGTTYPEDPDANFCELDGTRLISDAEYARLQGGDSSVAVVPAATGTISGCAPGECVDDGDGYCVTCGRKLTPAPLASPLEGGIATPPELAAAPFLGAVTDRGKRHPTNQDAVTVALESMEGRAVPVIVICDGVSSARHSEVTAAEATRVALEHLQGYVVNSTNVSVWAEPDALPTEPHEKTVTDLPGITSAMAGVGVETNPSLEAMRAAIIAAHEAVCVLDDAPDDTLEPPGCTIVASIIEPTQITVGWVGDSRAYLLAGDHSRLLTRDHSYVNDLIARGEMTEEESAQSQYAHVITLCLGPLNSDIDHPPNPAVVQIPRDQDGLLVLCTDGLWNYAPQPVFLAALAREAGPDADAQTIAHHLATFANTRGGLDNITVAVVRLGDLPPPLPPPPPLPASVDTPIPNHP